MKHGTDTRRAALALACVLMASTLFSCQSNTPGGENTGGADATSAPTSDSSADESTGIDDDLPVKDYGGKEFNITVNSFCESGFFVEEMSGDRLSDTIYDRNKTVEDRFNVKLNFISGQYGELATQIQNTVLSGEDEYQLLAQHAITADAWVSAGMLRNWYDIPYVDFEKPWWSSSNIDDLTYNNTAYLAVGDFSLTTIGRTYAIYYDKVFAESYQMPDMYELVDEGKWTIDKLSELSKDIYEDVNMDGKRDFGDFYGYSTSTYSNIGAFFYSSGLKIIENGEMVIDVGKTADLLGKLISLAYDNVGTFYNKSYANAEGNGNYAGAEKLAAGTTVFASAMIETGVNYLRNNDNDYGIIPYPKWNEEQSDYVTMVDGGFTILAIPKSVQDVEQAGIIAEALCAETYRQVLPVYYNAALKEKGARDERSIEMIDFIISKRVFDFGYVYDGWKGFGFSVPELVRMKNSNFASYYAKNISKTQKYYESVFESFGKAAENN